MSSADVELVLDAQAAIGEGPVWDERTQELLWVDIPAGLVHSFEPRSGRDEVLDVGQPVGVVALREMGGLVLGLRDGFALLDPDSSKVRLVAPIEADDRDTRMNDGACDRAGRFWAGTMALAMTRAAGSLYRLDLDLRATKVVPGLSISNGIGWSGDDRTMYLVDSGEGGIDAFDFDAAGPTLTNRRRLIDVPNEIGLPDGLAVDAEDNLWVALWGGWAVHRYTSAGELVTVIDVPAAFVTSCAFGGVRLDELYLTTAREGLSPAELGPQPGAGGLFRVRPGVHGLTTDRFAG